MPAKIWEQGPLETVFLLGTGICTGSWEPVRKAIDDVAPQAQVHVDPHAADEVVRAANDAANFWFASLAHRRRRIESMLTITHEQFDQRSGKAHSKDEFDDWKAKLTQKKNEFRGLDERLKEAIVRRLRTAVDDDTIRVREQCFEILRHLLESQPQGDSWFITTNWDMSLEARTERELGRHLNVDHMHGSTGFPERILLPSEVSDEPYRTWAERDHLVHSVLPHVPIGWARRVCIYGLSLSPLDAELGQTLSMGFEDHHLGPGTVLLINRGAELEGLKRRVRALGGAGWKVETIDVDSWPYTCPP